MSIEWTDNAPPVHCHTAFCCHHYKATRYKANQKVYLTFQFYVIRNENVWFPTHTCIRHRNASLRIAFALRYCSFHHGNIRWRTRPLSRIHDWCKYNNGINMSYLSKNNCWLRLLSSVNSNTVFQSWFLKHGSCAAKRNMPKLCTSPHTAQRRLRWVHTCFYVSRLCNVTTFLLNVWACSAASFQYFTLTSCYLRH